MMAPCRSLPRVRDAVSAGASARHARGQFAFDYAAVLSLLDRVPNEENADAVAEARVRNIVAAIAVRPRNACHRAGRVLRRDTKDRERVGNRRAVAAHNIRVNEVGAVPIAHAAHGRRRRSTRRRARAGGESQSKNASDAHHGHPLRSLRFSADPQATRIVAWCTRKAAERKALCDKVRSFCHVVHCKHTFAC